MRFFLLRLTSTPPLTVAGFLPTKICAPPPFHDREKQEKEQKGSSKTTAIGRECVGALQELLGGARGCRPDAGGLVVALPRRLVSAARGTSFVGGGSVVGGDGGVVVLVLLLILPLLLCRWSCGWCRSASYCKPCPPSRGHDPVLSRAPRPRLISRSTFFLCRRRCPLHSRDRYTGRCHIFQPDVCG